jgi:hypothetical protein
MLRSTYISGVLYAVMGILIQFLSFGSATAQTGPYLGQDPPGLVPELFAPDIFPWTLDLHSPTVFSPDATELYYSPMDGPPSEIMYMRMDSDSQWSQPQIAPFSSEYGSGDPFFSPDGERIYFLSWHPVQEGGSANKENIWYVEREGDSWGEPQPVGEEVNQLDVHWEASVDADYNLYFGGRPVGQEINDIYCSSYIDGQYTTPIRLGDEINTDHFDDTPFIAPDGSYLIFNRFNLHEAGHADLYISFKMSDGTWSRAQNMGPTINTSSHELYPVVTVDGRYLFFLSFRDGASRTYWVDAGIIESLRPEEDVCCECADCDGNGTVNILDALWEANCILGIHPQDCSCDCNQDGSNNVLDVLCVANIILGNSCP